MDSFAQLAQVDVLVVLVPISASSVDLEDLPTMVSVITLVLQDQLLQTTQLLVLIATLHVLLVSNILPNVLHVPHVVAHSSTSNVLLLALLEPTPLTELVNIVLIVVLHASDQTLLAQAVQLERFFTMVPAMINAPSS
jgi:hypothetical protein